jgi:predicted nuclease with TOPRIM domain
VHIITKIFVVLVSLLAVAIVPLAVVQSQNQAVLKQQVQDRDASLSGLRRDLDAERALRAKTENELQMQVRDLDGEKSRLVADVAQRDARVKGLEAEIAQMRIAQATIQQQVAVLAETDRTKTDLTKALNDELEKIRGRLADAEKIRIDLEQRVTKADADLEVAQSAVRDLKEQMAALEELKATADQRLTQYEGRYGRLADASAVGASGSPASAGILPGSAAPATFVDKDLVARVVNVRRSPEAVYAEIDAGSRDGVREGWVMTISDGDRFIGRLRISTVDPNRAVGTVELEEPSERGPVKAGQRVVARKGS